MIKREYDFIIALIAATPMLCVLHSSLAIRILGMLYGMLASFLLVMSIGRMVDIKKGRE
jgi:hypothetical protein